MELFKKRSLSSRGRDSFLNTNALRSTSSIFILHFVSHREAELRDFQKGLRCSDLLEKITNQLLSVGDLRWNFETCHRMISVHQLVMYDHGDSGINLKYRKLLLVNVFDSFLQRAPSRTSVHVEHAVACAGTIDADEWQRYTQNSGVHRVHQVLDISVWHDLLLDRILCPAFQFTRRYVAAGYLNLIGILELFSSAALCDFRGTGEYEQSRENENRFPQHLW